MKITNYSLVYKSDIPDPILYETYNKAKDSGRFDTTFFDGSINDSEHGFRNFVRQDSVFFWLLYTGQNELGFIWLTNVQNGGSANIHFCMHQGFSTLSQLRISKYAVHKLLRLKENDQYILHYLHGITPVNNSLAIRFISKAGFVPIGELPGAIFNAQADCLETALLSYATRETTNWSFENENI